MPPSPDSLQAVYATSEAQDFTYATQYVPETVMWGRLGVYRTLAELLPRRGVHVDLGAGALNLATQSKRQNPRRTVIGVDCNAPLLAVGVGVQAQLGMTSRVFHHAVLHQRPDGKLETLHLPRGEAERLLQENLETTWAIPPPTPFIGHQAREDRLVENPNVVHVVVDDIRRLELLKFLLGDEPPAAVSFISPGVSDSLLGPQGPRRDTAPAATDAAIQVVVDEVRQAAYAFAVERLRPGGTFLQAERLHAERANGRSVNAAMEADFTKALKRHLGGFADRFEHERTLGVCQAVNRPTDGVAWSIAGKRVEAPAYFAVARWKKK